MHRAAYFQRLLRIPRNAFGPGLSIAHVSVPDDVDIAGIPARIIRDRRASTVSTLG